MPMPTAQAVSIICPEGDLLLRVARKGNENLLLVSSRVLIEASGDFSRLLQLHRRPMAQPFAFTSPMDELKVSEDDGDALLTICNILHGRHQEVPMALSLHALKDIASSCNKYQLTKFLSAWSAKWVHHAMSKAVEYEVYIVVAIAMDLGISSTLVKHDTYRSSTSRPLCVMDQDLAGVIAPLYDFPSFLEKLIDEFRWPPLPENTANAKSCRSASKLFPGHVPRFAKVQRRSSNILADTT